MTESREPDPRQQRKPGNVVRETADSSQSAYDANGAVMNRQLELRGIPARRQVPVTVYYKGQTVGLGRIDMLVSGRLVVEVKAVRKLAPEHVAQLTSYLAALGQPLGLLLNIGALRLADGIRRVVRTK